MKSNFFKYIFILFVIGIVIFAIFKIRSDEEERQQEQGQITNKTTEKITEIRLGIAEFDSINPILSGNKNIQDITKNIY